MYLRKYGSLNQQISTSSVAAETVFQATLNKSPPRVTPRHRGRKEAMPATCDSSTTDQLWTRVRGEEGLLRPEALETRDQPGRTVRVFISSTFKDFYWEREALVRRVFPRLRAWCEERGIFLVECDLRWGVPKEASGDEAILSCLDEIARSIEETDADNFFLGLIGERYGWTPGPEDVNDAIREKFSWLDGASVTLMEIIHGAIRTVSPNALFMVRERDFIKALPRNWIAVFKEKGKEQRENVRQLQKYLRHLLVDKGQYRRYSCVYSGVEVDAQSGRERVRLEGLDDFAQEVLEFFTAAIERSGKVQNSIGGDKEHLDENEQHSVSFKALTRISQGHEALLERLFKELTSSPTPPLGAAKSEMDEDQTTEVHDTQLPLLRFAQGSGIVTLSGPAGSGKSTLMARLIRKIEATGNLFFYHFTGCTVTSKTETNLLERLLTFFNMTTADQSSEETGDDERKLLGKWKDCLADQATGLQPTPVYIVIDALDELTMAGGQRNKLPWLFYNFPPNVRCAVSCLEGGLLHELLRTRQVIPLTMTELETSDAMEIARKFFGNFGKRMDPGQLDSLISHQTARNPLWLTQACEELRIHGDYASLTLAIQQLPDDIEALNRSILTRLISEDKSGIVRRFFQMLYVSRAGIWETEVRQMLVENYKVDSELPQAVWSVLYRSMKSFVQTESVPIPVMKFRHRVLKQSVREALFETDIQVEVIHRTLAEYFENYCTIQHIKNIEYLYHLYHGNLREKLVGMMRTRSSWLFLPDPMRRSQLANLLKCTNPTNPTQKNNVLKLCTNCASMSGSLCLAGTNANGCYLCGRTVVGLPASMSMEARLCNFHESQRFAKLDHCILCDRPSFGKHLPCRLCTFCSMRRHCCSLLVTERDPLFRSQKQTSQHLAHNFAWS